MVHIHKQSELQNPVSLAATTQHQSHNKYTKMPRGLGQATACVTVFRQIME